MNLLIAGLATWQIVEIWHHSSLFAAWRSRVELWTNKLGELLCCPFCLSVWVGFGCSGLFQLPPTWQVSSVLQAILFGFACARLANLGNDLCYSACRTPRFKLEEVADNEV
jgi:hypothetical protein